jgi:hypothetical protein
MSKESREVLSKLNNVDDFHLKGHIHDGHPLLKHNERSPLSPEPRRHESGLTEDFVAPNRANDVVNDRISPLYESVDSLFSGLRLGVSLVGYVVFLAKVIENVVNEEVEELTNSTFTVKTKANGNP